MCYGYIYKTTNKINGKLYIGQKKGEFDETYLGSGIALQHAINKYGRNNFIVESLEYANTKVILNTFEKEYIKLYRSILGKDFLYNIANGGDGGFTKFTYVYVEKEIRSCLACKISFEVYPNSKQRFCSKKCSHFQKKVWIHKNNIDKKVVYTELASWVKNDWIIGRSLKVKQKLSLAKQGEKNPMFEKGYLVSGENNSQYGKRGKDTSFYGKKHTEEAKEKNRQAHLGKTAWNKGLTKETDLRVLKYCKSSKATKEKKKN